jgi:hypothetical protein
MSAALHTSTASAPLSRLGHRVTIAGVALVAFVLALGLFAMTVFNRAHNEQMYVAAAYLLSKGQRLYRDFAFVQMPYSVLNYALVNVLTGGGYFLLKAKLMNWLWMLLGAWLLFGRARRAAHDTLLALILLVLYFANYYLLRATIEASNYAMPLALALLAYVIWLRGVEGRMRYPLAAFLAGMALGGAVGAKLYYATLMLPFALAALLYPRHLTLGKRISQGILPLALGGLIALLPVGYYVLRDWELFAFNNLGYHTLNAQWREQNGFTDLSVAYKWDTARDLIGNPNYLILELWLAAALLLGWSQKPSKDERIQTLPAPGVFLAGTVALVSTLTAFTPTPLFPQYFAMPIPFLLLWMAELYGGLAEQARWVLLRLAVVCAVVGILFVLPRHTQSLARLLRGETWSGVVAVREAEQIRNALPSSDAAELPPLATLSPILALEADIPFYPELATGSFLLRVGDLLTPEQRARYIATSPSTLAALLDATPPAAILIGDEGDAEIPLRQYAEQHGYRPADFTLTSGELWLRDAGE